MMALEDRVVDCADCEHPTVQTVGERWTELGPATYIRIATPNYRTLTWTEVWKAFSAIFPGQWAVQAFPPGDRLVDEDNVYHLFVLRNPPGGMDICRG